MFEQCIFLKKCLQDSVKIVLTHFVIFVEMLLFENKKSQVFVKSAYNGYVGYGSIVLKSQIVCTICVEQLRHCTKREKKLLLVAYDVEETDYLC